MYLVDIRVQRFYEWLQTLVLRHIYKVRFSFFWAVSSGLTPKFSNSANMINKSFFGNAKKLSAKNWKSDRKMEFLTLITVCKSFSGYNFWVILFAFFQQIGTQHRILRFTIPIPKFFENIVWLLKLELFAKSLELNADETAEKN